MSTTKPDRSAVTTPKLDAETVKDLDAPDQDAGHARGGGRSRSAGRDAGGSVG
ncbi:MAG: hypothetical protein ACKVVT_17835 [Dehalococcoidia bacterium]